VSLQPRTLIFTPDGRPAVTEEKVDEAQKEILLEVFGLLTNITQKKLGMEGTARLVQDLITRIVFIVGKDRVEAKYPGLQITMPGEPE